MRNGAAASRPWKAPAELTGCGIDAQSRPRSRNAERRRSSAAQPLCNSDSRPHHLAYKRSQVPLMIVMSPASVRGQPEAATWHDKLAVRDVYAATFPFRAGAPVGRTG